MFEIHSLPRPQQQTKFTRRNGIHAYDPSKKDSESLIWQMRAYAPKDPLTGPLYVDITFLLPIPQSVSKSVRAQMIANSLHHIKRPDTDNLAYLITNAMKGLIYSDDSQIVDLCLHKRYAEIPKTIVKVMQL